MLHTDRDTKRVLMLRDAAKLTSDALTSIFTQELEFSSVSLLEEIAVRRSSLRIDGVSCGKCVATLRTALADDSRIVFVQMDLDRKIAQIYVR